MAEQDLARALDDAVQDAIRLVHKEGKTVPPDLFHKVAEQYPEEWEHAKRASMEWSGGKFDENTFREYLDSLRGHYKDGGYLDKD